MELSKNEKYLLDMIRASDDPTKALAKACRILCEQLFAIKGGKMKKPRTLDKKKDSVNLPYYVVDALSILEYAEAMKIIRALFSKDPFSYLQDDEAYLYAILTLALGAVGANAEVRDA